MKHSTLKQFKDMSGTPLSLRTLYTLVTEGEIKAFQSRGPGSEWLTPSSEVRSWPRRKQKRGAA